HPAWRPRAVNGLVSVILVASARLNSRKNKDKSERLVTCFVRVPGMCEARPRYHRNQTVIPKLADPDSSCVNSSGTSIAKTYGGPMRYGHSARAPTLAKMSQAFRSLVLDAPPESFWGEFLLSKFEFAHLKPLSACARANVEKLQKSNRLKRHFALGRRDAHCE